MKAALHRLSAGVRNVVREYPSLELEAGTRHAKARNPATGDFVCLPGSPSGPRWAQNLRAQLRRLDHTGRGFIATNRRGA